VNKYPNYKVCAIIVLLILGVTYWDKPIDKQYDCIEFNLDQQAFEKIPVTIKGKLRRSLFRKDMAQLNIKLGDREIPDLQKHHNIFPLNSDSNVVTYTTSTDELQILFKSSNTMEQYLDKLTHYYRVKIAYSYYDESNRVRKDENIGDLYIDKGVNKILIVLYKKESETAFSWSGSAGRVISSEATIEDSKKLLQDILKSIR
jgi:hypothetical protein